MLFDALLPWVAYPDAKSAKVAANAHVFAERLETIYQRLGPRHPARLQCALRMASARPR